MFSLVKEGEPVFAKDFYDSFTKKKLWVEQFVKFKSFMDPETPSLRNIALGLNSAITEAT